tara:strand:+ start:5350 stop:5820 length:471 start_codon:yes stop_codon:yes gene_type:complete
MERWQIMHGVVKRGPKGPRGPNNGRSQGKDKAPMLPGENIATAAKRLAKEWSVTIACARQWVNGQKSFKIGRENQEAMSRLTNGLRKAREVQEPGECWSLEKIASFAGCSRERIRQIEAEALRKVRDRTNFLKKELIAAGGYGLPMDTKGSNYGVD